MSKTSAQPRRSDRLALAIVGALCPALAGVVTAGSGALLGVTDLDVRMTWLAGGAIAVLVAARYRRPTASPWPRRVLLLLSLPLPLALVFPSNAWLVMWLSGGVLFLWIDALVWAFRVGLEVARPRIVRVGLATTTFMLGFVCLASFAIVIVNAQMSVVPARLVHLDPARADAERVVDFESLDGYRLEGTYTPGTRATGFVFAHGVGGGRGRFERWAERLGVDGHHVLRFDFRAHGRSDGSVCSYGQREDLDLLAAVDLLAGLADTDAERIVVVGASMGGGVVLVASEALVHRGVPGVVLLAPTSHYPPLVEARMRFLGPLLPLLSETAALPATAAGHVPMHRYSPRDIAAPARALPTLVFHGADDREISPSLTRHLADSRPNTEVLFLAGVGHSGLADAVFDDADAWAAFVSFADARLSETRTSRK